MSSLGLCSPQGVLDDKYEGQSGPKWAGIYVSPLCIALCAMKASEGQSRQNLDERRWWLGYMWT